jgi:hypothetical protein
MMIRFTLDGHIPPSTNELMRMHWAVRRRTEKHLRMWIIDAIATDSGEYKTIPPADWPESRRCRMTIRAFRKRHLDPDNAHGGLKLLIDAIKHLRLIHDDSPAWLDLSYDERIDGVRPRVEIEIEPMPETARDKSKRR